MNDQLEFTFEGTAKEKFDQYDNANPHIYELFKHFAFELLIAEENISAQKQQLTEYAGKP